jgi:hypothetical protein
MKFGVQRSHDSWSVLLFSPEPWQRIDPIIIMGHFAVRGWGYEFDYLGILLTVNTTSVLGRLALLLMTQLTQLLDKLLGIKNFRAPIGDGWSDQLQVLILTVRPATDNENPDLFDGGANNT